MSGARIPKPGEEWSYDGVPTPVVNVHSDAVTYLWRGKLVAETLETFIESYTPPEPTVVDSMWMATWATTPDRFSVHGRRVDGTECTHRLDLMSDGEFRVVKL